MSHQAATIAGLPKGNLAYQLTNAPANGLYVAVSTVIEPHLNADGSLNAVVVTVTGRWIDASGADKKLPTGQPVLRTYKETCYGAVDQASTVNVFLEGNAGAKPAAIASPIRQAIQMAQALGVT